MLYNLPLGKPNNLGPNHKLYFRNNSIMSFKVMLVEV